MERFDRVSRLIGSLDPIDFNLYIKEQEIDCKSLDLRFQNGKIDWNALGCEEIELNDERESEVLKLQTALIQQINQRSFFQEECRRLQHRYTLVQEQLETSVFSAKKLAVENEQLRNCIQAHETTNMSLQSQLSKATSGEEKSSRKRALRLAFEEQRGECEKFQKEYWKEKQLRQQLEAKIQRTETNYKDQVIQLEEMNRELREKLDILQKVHRELWKHQQKESNDINK